MRKFKLINANGDEFDLMRKDAFFHAPDGLGIGKEYEFMRSGTAYEPTELYSAQKTVSGEIVFSSYETYNEFIRFIAYNPLQLAYMPLTEWAYLDGYIVVLDKSEISENTNRLICAIEFIGTSLWYIPREAEKTGQDVQNAKLYNYTYDYQYADELNGVLRITNLSSEESPVKISIFGQIKNPTWVLSLNGVTQASGAMTGTIEEGHKLVINSKDGELEVCEYDTQNNFIANRYQDCDFDRETFLYAPSGTSTVVIGGIHEGMLTAWVEVEEVHETI